MSAQVAADLRAAADVLRRDGWCQRAWRDGDARCVAGALTRAVMDRTEAEGSNFDRPWQAASDALTLQVGQAAMIWNDVNGRTADEVIAALEAAADAAEASDV